MKNKIKLYTLYLFGWKQVYRFNKEPRLYKAGEVISWDGNPSNNTAIFSLHEAWEREFNA